MTRHRRVTSAVAVVVAGAMAPMALAQASAEASAPATPLTVSRCLVNQPDEQIGVLSNGLTVILKAHRTAPVVAVRMYCKTGSVYEQEYAGAGISHLFEHLLHGGETTTRSEEASAKVLSELGNNTNAFTSFSMTAYFINTDKENLTRAVELVADWITRPTFPEGPFQREWGVVQRELERDLDSPDRQLFYMLLDTMYLRHPARFPIIGHQQAVQSLTREDIIGYYHRMYVPDNIVVSIAGDMDPAEALNAVSVAFASFKRRPVRTITLPEEPEMTAPRTAIQRMNVQSAIVQWAWPSIPLIHPDLYPLDVLSFVLTQGESSRLVRSLVRDQKLAFSMDSISWTPDWARGVFAITSRMAPENVEAATDALWAEIRRVQSDPIGEEELAQAKRQKAAELVFANQTAEQVADSMARDFISAGDAHFSDTYVAKIQAVTAEQVSDVARRYLRPDRLGTIMILPQEEVMRETETTTRTAEPARMIVLDNGLRVVLRHDPSAPLVATQLYCLGGLLGEDETNNGISNMAAELMLRGTATRSADEIARFFDSRGASVGAASGSSTMFVQATVLREDFEDALEVLADVVLHPAFAVEEVERLRPRLLDAISQIDESWRSELNAYFFRRFFSKSPYCMQAIGSADAVQKLDSATLAAYHRRCWVGPNTVLTIFGDFDPATVEAAVAKRFAAMSASALPRPAVPAEPSIEQPTLYIKAKGPDRRAAGIYVGFRGMTMANTKDRYPMAVLDTIMSGYGYPGGWLHEGLRGGDRDLVYEVHAINWAVLEPGFFGAYAACQPEKVSEVYRIMTESFERARAGDFDDDELERAKGVILSTELMRSQTNSDRATQAALDELYGLGFDHREHYVADVQGVTREDVCRVAKKYLTQPIVTVVTPQPELVDIGVAPAAIDRLEPALPATEGVSP
ncbi:MAG: insulinase family protein [Phycisphaerae bacterium]|nr:insulinase family protein [Phycisphaerae bacterium]